MSNILHFRTGILDGEQGCGDSVFSHFHHTALGRKVLRKSALVTARQPDSFLVADSGVPRGMYNVTEVVQ